MGAIMSEARGIRSLEGDEDAILFSKKKLLKMEMKGFLEVIKSQGLEEKKKKMEMKTRRYL